jgi:hypothetical protein
MSIFPRSERTAIFAANPRRDQKKHRRKGRMRHCLASFEVYLQNDA